MQRDPGGRHSGFSNGNGDRRRTRSRSPLETRSGTWKRQDRRKSRSPAQRGPRRDRDREEVERGAAERGRHASHSDDQDRHHRHHRHGDKHRRRGSHASQPDGEVPAELPYGARALSRGDFAAFEPLFAYYLELHKGLAIDELGKDEVRGRWKRFISKWNHGGLAEGWYEPEMFQRIAQERLESDAVAPLERQASASPKMERDRQGSFAGHDRSSAAPSRSRGSEEGSNDGNDDYDDDDNYGPAPPPQQRSSGGQQRHGPGIPNLQELEERRELDAEERAMLHVDLNVERQAERRLQKERLEELVPRAEPGTHERRLEKRRAANEAARAFRDKSPDGGDGDGTARDGELMGGGDGVVDFKRAVAVAQRRKTAREIRREEIARARDAEREQRMQAYRVREERTVGMLRELAKQRFG